MKIVFENSWHPIVAIAVIAILIGLAYWFYRRNLLRAGRRAGALLLGLRVAAIIALLLLILKPVVSWESAAGSEKCVMVLLDESMSMKIPDQAGGASRFDAARELLLAEKDGIYRRLKGAFPCKLFAFSGDSRLIEDESADKLSPCGDMTDIRRSLTGAAAAVGVENVHCAVIVTDGAENSSAATGEASRTLDFPVFAIGIGRELSKEKGFSDLAIVEIETPDTAFRGNTVEVSLKVRRAGDSAPVAVPVTLTSGGAPIGATSATFGAGVSETRVLLAFVPRTAGLFEYEVSVTGDKNELLKENNYRSFALQVLDAKLKVLFVEGNPRWEYKFIKEALDADPNVNFGGAVMTSAGRYQLQGAAGKEAAKGLPASGADYRKYDVIMLGDISPHYFTAEQLSALESFVSDGGGFVLVGGKVGEYHSSPIAKLLSLYATGRKGITKEFTPQLTAEGARHPIMRGCDRYFGGAGDEVCRLGGCTYVGKPKPGATVLLEYRGAVGATPVVAVQRYGDGKSMLVATDTTWLWHRKFRMRGLDSPFVRFWGQAVRWLAGRKGQAADSESPLALWTNKLNYIPGETVHITAQVEEKKVAARSQIEARIECKESGEVRKVILKREKSESSEFVGEFVPESGGRYQLSAVVRDTAGEPVQQSREVMVGRRYLEFESPDMNSALLSMLASATGGRYYSLPQARTLLEDIETTRRGEPTRTEITVWDSPFFFLLFIGLLTAEWVMRKRKMLV